MTVAKVRFWLVVGVLLLAMLKYSFGAEPTCFKLAGAFDGGKFKARYGLTNDDFSVTGDQLCLKPGITIPDNPLILEVSDPQVARRTLEKDRIDRERVLRAIVLLVLDEFNAHANKINAILDAVDQSVTLADLKLRIAAIPDYPQRTGAQLLNAIKNKIDSGDAD